MESVDVDDINAFLVESYENLSQIEQSIIGLEKASNPEAGLIQVYRSLHTLKGNCGFLPFPKLEAIAHESEALIGKLRDRTLTITPQIVDRLLQSIDAIRQILTQIDATHQEGDQDHTALLQSLKAIQTANGHVPDIKPSNLEASVLSVAESSIRVDVGLLDRVINLVGELVLARNQLLQFSSTIDNSSFNATCKRLDFVTAELQEGVIRTRMQPMSTIWQKLPRVVRDLAIAQGKQVNLELEGSETELDRSILEAIKAPLTHVVRNCIDHGIESPSIRLARGKSAAGRLFLHAYHEGGRVNLDIRDDGGGIDPQHLKQKAQQMNLITATEAATMSDSEAIDLIFLPGFSTAQQVTNLSGRGVGMNIVKTDLEKINGTIEVESQIGTGTTFKVKIPLTLAIIPALIVKSGGAHFAIPQVNLQELIRFDRSEEHHRIETLYNVPVYRLRGSLLPLIYLDRELQLSAIADENISIAVINIDEYCFGLVIDRIEDTQDIVVKPLGKQLKAVSTFMGATILGDGSIALILDAIGLANHAGLTAQLQKQLADQAQSTVIEEQDRQTILLFEAANHARMGIPMSIARRLETFEQAKIEKTSTQFVVQYNSEILPLIDLYSIFLNVDRDLTQFEALEVVVISINEQHCIGWVIDRVLDIVETSLTVKGAASRSGVLFNAAVQGQATEILDVEAVIRTANPYYLQSVR